MATNLPSTPPNTPLYRRLARRLQERIDAGGYPAGARLPSEPELSAEFGVNRLTVRQAVAELERAAVVEIRRGVGTFVRPPAVRVSIAVDPRSQRFDLGSVHEALPEGEQGDGEFVVAAPPVTGSRATRAAALRRVHKSRITRARRASMGWVKVASRPLPRALGQETAASPERLRESTGPRASTRRVRPSGTASHHTAKKNTR